MLIFLIAVMQCAVGIFRGVAGVRLMHINVRIVSFCGVQPGSPRLRKGFRHVSEGCKNVCGVFLSNLKGLTNGDLISN